MKKILFIIFMLCQISFSLSGKNLIFYNYIRYNNPKISQKETMFILKYVYINSKKYDISKELILAVMKVESNFNMNVRSHADAYGYMQIIPDLANHLKINRNDRKQNIEAGVRYLAMSKKEFGGYNNNMIAGYNRGINGVKKYGYQNVKETREYVVKVNKELKILNNEIKLLRNKQY